MKLNFSKAIRNTHRHPVSRALHLVGLSLYIAGFTLLVIYYFGRTSQDISFYPFSLILFPIAVMLFIAGHKIEGNLRAMTLIVMIKFLRSKIILKWFWKFLDTVIFFTRHRLRNRPQTLPSQIPLSNPPPRLDSRDY